MRTDPRRGPIEFLLLGPLEIRSESGEISAPKRGKQRLLLAALLLHAPRVASADRLVDILWPDRRPAHPGAALRTQVSRLRAHLDKFSGAAGMLRGEAGGYRLAVVPEQLDAGRFEAILDRVHSAAPSEQLLGTLDDALGLWRGDPFEDLGDRPQFLGEATRLETLRTSACERRVECLLALGRSGEALAAVAPLIRADPLRERPRALGMEALYRAGRQHEALALFQEYRRLLSDELGLNPSPALRRLEAEILKHGESLAVDVPRVAMAPAVGPQPPRRGLPLAITRMIGREGELVSIRRLLRSTRLLTLTGAGGSGKTRLALEVAAQARGTVADEVAWVGLETLSDPELVAPELAASLGTSERPGRSAVAALAAAIRGRSILLVLDNCEHLVEACARTAGALLGECPDLVILATSREPLGITGEVTWSVPPLPRPGEDGLEPDDLGRYAAVRLFVERARAVRPDFELTAANAADVLQICRRLDGLPLALELAAARLRALSPGQIAARLDRRFSLLTAGSRTALPRHQTLRAAIDWSYDLLAERERRLIERLSIFAGGFSLEAVEAVEAAEAAEIADSAETAEGAGGNAGSESGLETLAALVEKSLVAAEPGGGSSRYRLLETVRHYARERLEERDGAAAAARRHAEYFTRLAETAGPLLLSPHRVAWARRLSAEADNLRAALTWATGKGGDGMYALRLAGSLWWFWHYVGRLDEGRRWIERVMALPEAAGPHRQRAALLYAAAKSNWMLGDPAAALPYAEEGVRLCRGLDERDLLVHACVGRSLILLEHGDLPGAERSAAEALDVARRDGGSTSGVALPVWARGCVQLAAGALDRASAEFGRAAELWAESGDNWGLSEALRCQAMAELGRGATAAALGLCGRAVVTLRDEDETWFLCRVLEVLAAVVSGSGDAAAGTRLLGAADALRESIRAPVLGFERPGYDRTIASVREKLGARRFSDAWNEGRSLDMAGAVRLALAACDPPPRPPTAVDP